MSLAGRIAAIAAVVVAIVVVAVLLFSSGGGYTVKAVFLDAGQLVSGNNVEVGGNKVGSVNSIDLTPNGQAIITMSVDKPFSPLRQGTIAVIRQASLSGIANRYVDLELPSGDQHNTPTIRSGATIPVDQTKTVVDLDQLFNTFDPTTRKSLQEFFVNSNTQYAGKTQEQQLAYHYLNPALSTSSRLFNELNRDQPLLARFLVNSAALVNDLAAKRNDLAALVGNLNTTFHAIGSQKAALTEDLQRLPGFMRQANTTFVDLRAALNDVDPLVNASKPVAPKLSALLSQLQPLAHDARPTVRDLAAIVCRSNSCPTAPPYDDLYHLERTLPPLANIALDTQQRSVNFQAPGLYPDIRRAGGTSVGTVRGAFPETTQALKNSAPIIAFGRPYTPELTGWFDDFSTPGSWDALGDFSRAFTVFNSLSAQGAVGGPLPSVPTIPLNQQLQSILSGATPVRLNQFRRCPGGAEEAAADGSNVPSPQVQQIYDCNPNDRASGPVAGP